MSTRSIGLAALLFTTTLGSGYAALGDLGVQPALKAQSLPGLQLARKGADDGPNHDVNDDRGGDDKGGGRDDSNDDSSSGSSDDDGVRGDGSTDDNSSSSDDDDDDGLRGDGSVDDNSSANDDDGDDDRGGRGSDDGASSSDDSNPASRCPTTASASTSRSAMVKSVSARGV